MLPAYLELIRQTKTYLFQQYPHLIKSPKHGRRVKAMPPPAATPRHVPSPPVLLPKEPAQEEKKPKVEKAPLPASHPEWALEPLPKAPSDPFTDLFKWAKEKVPQLKLVETIPSDEKACRKKNSETCPPHVKALVFFCEEAPDAFAFLQNMTAAIAVHFGPAALLDVKAVEKSQGWNALLQHHSLRLLILQEEAKNFEGLKQALNEKAVPILWLAPVANYLKNPSLKVKVWEALCQALA